MSFRITDGKRCCGCYENFSDGGETYFNLELV